MYLLWIFITKIMFLNTSSASIDGLTFMDDIPQRMKKETLKETMCKNLYWYPRHLPDFCYEPTPNSITKPSSPVTEPAPCPQPPQMPVPNMFPMPMPMPMTYYYPVPYLPPQVVFPPPVLPQQFIVGPELTHHGLAPQMPCMSRRNMDQMPPEAMQTGVNQNLTQPQPLLHIPQTIATSQQRFLQQMVSQQALMPQKPLSPMMNP